MGNSLAGKVAIITGAAKGQGEAEARLFHAEGASVVLTDLDESGADVAASLGSRATFLRHNVANDADWQAIAAATDRTFGRIDILINNAGVTGYEPVTTITAPQMQRYLDIHLYGALFGIQAVLPAMSREGGSIVNVASTAALRGMPGYSGYGVSKWALRGLTRYAAHDLVSRKIRVNSILPGGVETTMLIQPDAEELISSARNAVPMRRFGEVREIATIALFLCSDAATYMTGAEIVADGGLNA